MLSLSFHALYRVLVFFFFIYANHITIEITQRFYIRTVTPKSFFFHSNKRRWQIEVNSVMHFKLISLYLLLQMKVLSSVEQWCVYQVCGLSCAYKTHKTPLTVNNLLLGNSLFVLFKVMRNVEIALTKYQTNLFIISITTNFFN